MNQGTEVMLSLAITVLLGVGVASEHDSTQGSIKCNFAVAVIAKAKSPAPPADTKKATSIGKGNVKVNTANSSEDTDSSWDEQAGVVWDDEDKMRVDCLTEPRLRPSRGACGTLERND